MRKYQRIKFNPFTGRRVPTKGKKRARIIGRVVRAIRKKKTGRTKRRRSGGGFFGNLF